MKSIVYGEVLWDIFPDKKVIGGASFNFAAHLAQLDNEVYFVSGVGQDELGEDTLRIIKRYGVSEKFVRKNGKRTGACIVSLDSDGMPSYNVLADTAYDNITLDADAMNGLKSINADLFYFNTLAQRNEVSRNTLKQILAEIHFENIFCDINIRKNCYDYDSIKLCFDYATVVKVSGEEAHYLYDTGILPDKSVPLSDALHAAFPGIRLLVYTMGGEGSVVYDYRNGRKYESGVPEKVKVVSTVGAGDCYSAAFASCFLSGESIPECIKTASHRSGIVVASTEAIPESLLRRG